MSNANIFKAPSDLSEAAKIFIDHLPQGRAWGKKADEDSDMYGLIKGLSQSFLSVLEQIELLSTEFDINQTDDLIDEWEESVGIPDDCVFQFPNIEDRRSRVIQRLRKEPIRTLAELQAYIDGFFTDGSVTLSAGTNIDAFEYSFEMDFFGGVNDKFIIVASVDIDASISESTFEFDFEMALTGGTDTTLLNCLLRKVIPANVAILINFVE